MNTFEQLQAKVAAMELKAVNFLTKKGEFASKKSAVDRVEFIFIDDEKLVLPKAETESVAFDQLKFRLRPSRDH